MKTHRYLTTIFAYAGLGACFLSAQDILLKFQESFETDGLLDIPPRYEVENGNPEPSNSRYFERRIIPADGVYAVTIVIGRTSRYLGMLNIGNNPTFEGTRRTIEVNIFDFDQDIYDKDITLEFYRRIRDEVRFDSVDDLVDQLNDDKFSALKILNSIHG